MTATISTFDRVADAGGRRRYRACGPTAPLKSAAAGIAVLTLVGLLSPHAAAQQPAAGIPGISIRGTITDSQAGAPPLPAGSAPAASAPPPFAGTVVVTPPAAAPGASRPAPPAPPAQSATTGRLQLAVLLTRDGNRIASGIVWRVYANRRGSKPTLVATERIAEPQLTLPAGSYIVVASFGLAYITQKVEVRGGGAERADLVLNAGGLRVSAGIVGGGKAVRDSVTFDILSEQRDATGERIRVVGGVKPGRIVRLNSGIYQLVSQLGDANATVKSEVTVEAGKLSEVQVTHQAARVTFKLADRPNGEAIADTQWVVLAGSGGIVKETVGALPTHMLAPGTYTVSATSAGRMYQREFAINSGDTMTVEVLAQQQ